MRLISQDGNIDVPYERICLEVYGDSVFADIGKDYKPFMGTYSSKEKLEKAMKNLHDCYTGMIYCKNVNTDEDLENKLKEMMSNGFEIVKIRDDGSKAEFRPLNVIFRFPKDEDVVV